MANTLKDVGDWLADLVEKVRSALEDEPMRQLIAEDLGLPPNGKVPKPTLPQDKLDSISAYRAKADPDKEAFAQLLADVRAVYESVRAFVASLGVSSVTTQNQVIYRLFDLFALNEMRVRAPGAFAAVQLFSTIVEDTAEGPGLTTDDLVQERFFKAIALALEFGLSPVYYLFRVLSAKDAAAAKKFSDQLFPQVAGAIAYTQRAALDDSRLQYGWDALVVPTKEDPLQFTRASLTPHADELAERMLTIGFPFGHAPTDGSLLREAVDLTFAIIPESHGELLDPNDQSTIREGGLLIGVGGEGGLEIELSERWKFLLEASAKPAFSIFVRHGRPPRITNGRGPTDLPLNVALVTVPDEQNVTYAFPHRDETRVEIGQLAFVFSFDGRKGGIKGELRRGAIVVATKDQDGFLARFLPKDGLRIPFEFGAGFDTGRGFFTEGNVPLLSGHSTGPLRAPAPNVSRNGSGALRAAFDGNGTGPAPGLSSSSTAEPGLQQVIPIGRALPGIRVNSLLLALTPAASLTTPQAKGEVSLSLTVKIGPIEGLIERIGFETALSFPESGGNAGFADFRAGFKPPSGVGITVEHPSVSGGGFLFLDFEKGQYAGVMQLAIEGGISVKAVGLIFTRLPDGRKGFSFLILITVEDFRPIPLGLGFSLTGIGGLLAINRTADQDALREGIKNKTLNDILFPRDPVRNAPQILGTLNRVFPVREGSHLFGPVVQICWFTPPLVTMDLGVILEIGNRTRLIVLGRVSAILPNEKSDLIRIQMNAVGIIDFDEKSIALDAVLYDSRLAGKFPITGSMALRVSWGATKQFALSIGGFHPAFKPPPKFPALERLAISFSDTDSFRLRVEGYFALTANTVQWGARAELFAKAAGFSITGQIGYDVLIQLDPFGFIADFHASVQLKRGSHNLFKVSVEGELRGPRPLHLKGKATFEIFWCDITVHVDRTLVSGQAPPRPQPVRVMEQLRAALDDPRNWSGQLGEVERAVVTVRQPPTAPATAPPTAPPILLHPLGRIAVKQTVVPLDVAISRFGAATPADATRLFAITRVTLNGSPVGTDEERDFFAPAQFLNLSDAEKLAAPSFAPMNAGVSLGTQSFVFSTDDANILEEDALAYETCILDASGACTAPPVPFTVAPAVLDRQIALGAAARSDVRRTGAARYRPAFAKNVQRERGWAVVSRTDLSAQAVAGHAGLAAPTPASYAEAFQALEQVKREDPARARGLMLLRR